MFNTATQPVALYPKQENLVNKIRQSFSDGNTRPIVQASTGFGKSIVAGYIIKSALEKGCERVVLIVDSLTLVDQLIETFENKFGLDCGVIQGIHHKTNLTKRVQIATPQTLSRRFESNNLSNTFKNYNVDLVIVDEAHGKFKGTIQALDYWDCKTVGFTATPFAKGLGLIYDDLVKADSLEVLMNDGDLAKYKAFSHETPDFKGLTVGANGDIQGASDRYDDGLIGDVYKTWSDSWSSRLTIGFAPTIAKCEAFAKLFRDNGVNSIAVHSKLNNQDADAIINSFKSGDIRVIWSVAKLVKGFDVPEASCLIDCQPTHSLMRHAQKCGRVLRKHSEKEFAVILDHAGNMIRNGLLEDIGVDSLDNGEGTESNPDRTDKAEPKPIACTECKAILEKFKVQCPQCGHTIEKTSRTDNPDAIDSADGELKELKRATKQEKQSFYSGLLHEFQKINFTRKTPMSKGWIAHKYKDKFGVFPRGMMDVSNYSKEASNYVKYTNIKFAKSKKKTGMPQYLKDQVRAMD